MCGRELQGAEIYQQLCNLEEDPNENAAQVILWLQPCEILNN